MDTTEFDRINNLLAALEVESDDYTGIFPMDIRNVDFCAADAPGIEEPTMTMEEIDEILDSVKDLCDPSAMANKVNSMVNDIMTEVDKGNKPDKTSQNMSPSGKLGIIEFGDDYTKGDKVEYGLWVKPGQVVDSSTLFGWVVQDDEKRTIQSIYSTGEILASDPPENTKFQRLFPSKASRHILIANYTIADGAGFSESEVDQIAGDMNDCTDLFNLIKDHMVPSTLPLILANHELKKEHVHGIEPCPNASYVKGDVQYNPLMKEYFDVIDKYSNKYKDICSSKKIKAAKGTSKGHRGIADQCMDLREQMLDDIIKIYAKPRDKALHIVGCSGGTGYDNCLKLGNVDYNGTLSYDTIKSSVYGNYYVYLLSSLQIDSESKYIKEYVELLKGIIMNRSRYEEINQSTLSKEFNKLYTEHINSDSETGYEDLMQITSSTSTTDLESALKKLANTGLQIKAQSLAEEYIEINEMKDSGIIAVELKAKRKEEFNKTYQTYIDCRESKGFDVITKESNGNQDWLTEENIKRFILKQADSFINSKDNLTYPVIMMYQRLARIANYISEVDDSVYKVNQEFNEKYTPLDLVTEEAEKIKTFWAKAISAYKGKPIASLINDVEDLGKRLDKFAEWPAPVDITISGQEYQHWLFKNPFESKDKNIADDGDADAENYDCDNMNIDDIQNNGFGGTGTAGDQSVSSPSDADAAAAMENGGAARQSANDPSEKEITIVDTEYWVKYFSLATVITLPFLADGLDIPPTMTPVPLPCIYIAFKAIHIKLFDVVLVIGLAIRGIYISPVLLTVNLSDKDISPLLPLVAILKQVRSMFQAAISTVEMTIPNIIGLLINKLEMENQEYRRKNIMYTNQLKTLEMQMFENQGLIKKRMDQLRNPKVDTRQNIFRTEDVAGN